MIAKYVPGGWDFIKRLSRRSVKTKFLSVFQVARGGVEESCSRFNCWADSASPAWAASVK